MKRSVFLFIVAFCIFVFNMSAFAQKTPQKEWTLCEKNSDCVIIDDGCYIHTVNRKYKTEAAVYFSNLIKGKKCPVNVSKRGHKATCIPTPISCRGQKNEDGSPMVCPEPESYCSAK